MKITHDMLDRRSLALHRVVADKLRRQPELVNVARENLRRWADDDALPPSLDEWRKILETCSHSELLELLTDPGENATRLRQSSPFGGILSEPERLAIVRQHEPRAA